MAGDKVQKEFIHKDVTFSVPENTNTQITNKYGNVEVKTNQENVTSVKVIIKVEADNDEDINRIISAITVDVQNVDGNVTAVTYIDDDMLKKSWFSNLVEHSEFEINYYVTIPVSGSAKIYNKYGDVKITNLNGAADLHVKYGGLYAGRLNSTKNKIELDYGKMDISYLGYADVDIAYCDHVNIRKVKLLELSAKYSDLKVGAAGRINSTLAYSEFEVGAVAEVIVDMKYSELECDKVTKKAIIEAKYSDVSIDQVSKDFKEIVFDGAYSDMDISIHQNSSYKLSGTSRYADVSIPSAQFKETSHTSKSFTKVNGENPSATIQIDIAYGECDLNYYE